MKLIDISTPKYPATFAMVSDEVAAAKAYDEAAREKFGEFARLNFPAASK